MKYFRTLLIATLSGLAILTACTKDDQGEKQAEIDEQLIVDYLTENNIEAIRHESGMYYLINNAGAGLQPTVNSTVEVYYKGYFMDGNIFDQTTQGPVTFALRNLIPGWQTGIPLLKEGGSGTFFLPSALGYGTTSSGSVPPNTVIIFDIDLISVL
jgi:FKBP-type peptidyl-prolyl cis-trans isomerase FkpA